MPIVLYDHVILDYCHICYLSIYIILSHIPINVTVISLKAVQDVNMTLVAQ